MRGARLSSALRRSMFSVAVAAVLLPTGWSAAQDGSRRPMLPGAMLIQAVDTSINPIPAEVLLPAFELSIRLSDEEGAILLLNVPDGLYLVQARRLGHRPEWRFVRVTQDTARVDFVLAPAELRRGPAVDGLAASRLRDFLRRTGTIPMGSFLTRSEIDKRRPRDLVALLARVPEVAIDRNAAGPPIVRSRRAPAAQCAAGMLLLVDATLSAAAGVAPVTSPPDGRGDDARPIGDNPQTGAGFAGLSHARHHDALLRVAGLTAFPRKGSVTAARRAPSVLERVPISSVAAVEVYPTLAGVPPEFRVAGAECGMVLVWTVGS